MALKVYLDDGCKAERSCVVSLFGRKRQGWPQRKSLGNSPFLDFIEVLQIGWWWDWRCSMHQVTPWPLWAWGWGLPHCLHRLSKQGRQKTTSEVVWDPFVYQKKNQHKRCESWTCCDTDVLQTWFLRFPSTSKFWQIRPVVSNVLIFISRTHSSRIWSCQNITKKISCWVWSLLHSCESETGRRNLLQICNFLATVRMQILLLWSPWSDITL